MTNILILLTGTAETGWSTGPEWITVVSQRISFNTGQEEDEVQVIPGSDE